MQIIFKEILSNTPENKVTRLDILAPDIAQKALPGQFVVVMVSAEGERIPLTVVNTDKQKGTLTIIFQEVGLTTRLLGRLNSGDSLYAIVGPLGHPTQIKDYGKVILVGGGVGIAEIYPVAKAFKEAGNQVTSILGARSKDILILEKELKGVSDDLYVTTDDGSYARKGFTTDVLAELLEKDRYGLVYAVGPIPMMKRVAIVTQDSKVKTIVSLNALMVDATGMCGCCRVNVAGEIKFSCVDGPEFDAGLVDWEELINRNRLYLEQEKHICKLKLE
ncbi:MAG: sulfide/dihydroorotate dehydrogenase-like FAD/NAD-binding protein [Candidatus Omnitrophota bacterium]